MHHLTRKLLPFIGAILIPCAAQAGAMTDLPNALEKLSSDDQKTVIQSLETLGRICDESCVPYVLDMLHHHQAEIVIAACRTASELANPAFAPALLELVRNHPADSVRFEAIQALTSLGAAYEALLMNIDPEHPDEIQRQIIRHLPENQRTAQAARFASFAGYHELVSSVVNAYRKNPEILYAELFPRITSSPAKQKHNMFRAILLLAETNNGEGITEHQAHIFNDNPTPELPLIAQIQAERSTPDAVQWLLAWTSDFSEPILLDIFSRLHNSGKAMYSDALLQIKDPAFQRIIEHNPRLMNAFLASLPASENAEKLALKLIKQPEYHVNALQLLARCPNQSEYVLRELGNANPIIAITAFQIISSNPKFIPALVNEASIESTNDNFGRIFLIRWALVIQLSHKDAIFSLSADDREKLKKQAEILLQTPQKLHAEPAFWLLRQLGYDPHPPAPDQFAQIRPDMRRAWIRAFNEDSAMPYIEQSLNDKDESIIAETLEYLTNHPQIASKVPELDEMLIKFIESESTMLSTQAAAAAAQLGKTACIPVLQNALTSADMFIAYNALWALQKLHALPNEHWLKSLYFRAQEGVLRDRLGFLTGLDPNRVEKMPMSELDSLKQLHPGEIIQMMSQNEPFASQNITVLRDDQSLRIFRTNSFGILFL